MTRSLATDTTGIRDERDFPKGGTVRAPEGRRFIVFGKIDKKHLGGSSWMGIQNMKKGSDWFPIIPAKITTTVREVGYIYRLKRELKK